MKTILTKIRTELKQNATEKNRESSQRFFKEKIKCYGVTNPVVHKISKEVYMELKDKQKIEIFEICDKLWQSGFIEESLIASNLSYFVHKKFEENDFEIFERWIKNYVNNWASCDTFCNHTVGEFLEMYPKFVTNLKEFARSKNMWVRRASAVSLILPARKGMFKKHIFEISDLLLTDKEDLVQKGYGWLLKELSKSNQNEVFRYVMKNKISMPRTALRYAIEKMPDELRRRAMG